MGISTIAYLFLPKLTRLKPVGRSLDMVLGGVAYVRSNSIVLGAIALDLFIVLMGSVVTLLPVYAADILNVGPESLGVLRGMPALGGVVVGLGLAALPPMRRSGALPFRRAAGVCSVNSGFCGFDHFLGQPCGLVCLWRSRYGKCQYPHDPYSIGHTRSSSRQS
jgi:hypothetical protein